MADKSLLLPVGIPQNISIILASCISDELFSGYQGNQICITRKNHIFLFMHTWAARATLENGLPEQHACSLKGTWLLISCGMSACGARNITSRPSLCSGVCSTGKTQGLWRPLHFLNGMRGSRRQVFMGKADHPQMSAVRKQSLVLTVFQLKFLRNLKF